MGNYLQTVVCKKKSCTFCLPAGKRVKITASGRSGISGIFTFDAGQFIFDDSSHRGSFSVDRNTASGMAGGTHRRYFFLFHEIASSSGRVCSNAVVPI